MLNFLIKKALLSFLSLMTILSLTFFLMKAIPGDPFVQEQAIPKEILASLYRYYGLDQPLYVQYLKYLKGFFTFDFGPSLVYQGKTAMGIIQESFPISLTLGLEALLLSVSCGLSIGILCALKHNHWQDHLFKGLLILGISLPSFLLAAFYQYAFALKLHIFPVARWDSILHTVLPALSLSALPTAFIAKLTRTGLIGTFKEDFIKTATSKGLSKGRILFFHALPSSILPVISYLAPVSAHIVTGSFVIEKIFGIPGLGQWLIISISNRDYPLILGITIFYSSILIFFVFIADLLYCVIDPTIRACHEKK